MSDLTLTPSTETFAFSVAGIEKVFELPLLRKLSGREVLQASRIARIKDKTELDQAMTEFVLSIIDEHCPDLLDVVGIDDISQQLIPAWYEASRMNLGESQASPSPSTTAGQ